MAGTLVLTTLSDGTNSTSATNAIRGSAKAWVSFQGGQPSGTAGTINSSYNVSSITVNAGGDYTVNYTNAFSNTNYCPVGSTWYDDAGSMVVVTFRTLSTSSTRLKVNYQNGSLTNTTGVYIAAFA